MAHGLQAPEPRSVGYIFQTTSGRINQVDGVRHTLRYQPCGRTHTGRRLQSPRKRAFAGRGLCRHPPDRPLLVQPRTDAIKERRDFHAPASGFWAWNELLLSALPLCGKDKPPRHTGRFPRTKVSTDDVETEIQARRRTCSGQDLPIIDEQPICIDIDLWVAGLQCLCIPPVGRRAFPA